MPARLSRRTLLKAGASAGSLACAAPALGFLRASSARPNIIFLLADDLRYDAVGYLNHTVRTPNLDALAKEGVRFHNTFVTTSICAISRASIFTGMYARRHGICNFQTPLSSDLIKCSYPWVLRNAGYRTGFFGKYGVGDMKIDASGKVLDAQLPEAARASFDVVEDYGFSYYLDGDTEKKNHIHGILGDRAEEFIRSNRADQPFCLSISFVSPHEHADNFEWTRAKTLDEALPVETELLDHYNKTKDISLDTPAMTEAAFFRCRSSSRNLWLERYGRPRWQSLPPGANTSEGTTPSSLVSIV